MGNEVVGQNAGKHFLCTLWQPAGVIYLCFCLAGLAAGLWHDRIVPQFSFPQDTTLPTLQTLAATQVFFFLLMYPIILLRRQQGTGNGQQENNFTDGNATTANSQLPTAESSSALRTPHFAILLELAGMFIATLPLYVITAWLSDAAAKDVLRAILAVAAICPLGILAGRLFVYPAWRGWVMLVLFVIVLGLPGAWYICVDFLGVSGGWAQLLSPVLLAWRSAAARQITYLPQPLWPWLLWPILATAGGLILWVFPSRRST